MADKLTAERVRELLDYDRETGLLLWRVRPVRAGSERTIRAWNTRYADKPAGYVDPEGYVIVCIDGVRYRAHRLAWAHVTGRWPTAQIDHIDGARANNAWANLREATNSQNQMNRHNRGGGQHPRGVFRDAHGRFRARIKVNGRRYYLGSFDTPCEAHAAYRAAALQVHGEFANPGSQQANAA